MSPYIARESACSDLTRKVLLHVYVIITACYSLFGHIISLAHDGKLYVYYCNCYMHSCRLWRLDNPWLFLKALMHGIYAINKLPRQLPYWHDVCVYGFDGGRRILLTRHVPLQSGQLIAALRPKHSWHTTTSCLPPVITSCCYKNNHACTRVVTCICLRRIILEGHYGREERWHISSLQPRDAAAINTRLQDYRDSMPTPGADTRFPFSCMHSRTAPSILRLVSM